MDHIGSHPCQLLMHKVDVVSRPPDGYNLTGPAKTKCHFGSWTGETPSCKEYSDRTFSHFLLAPRGSVK